MLGERLPAARPLQAAATFTEAKHPRHPKGSEKGGQFASKEAAREAYLAREAQARAYVPPPAQARDLADREAFKAKEALGRAADAFYDGSGSLGELRDALDKLERAVLIRAEAG